MERATANSHSRFDFQAARIIFEKTPNLRAAQITSPVDLFSVETLRDRHRLRTKPAYATDVFVWGMGRPRLPHLTKVSGLPYWPKNKPWPTDDEGKPLKFLAQFCLLDSRDLVPSAPGDLLLIFVPEGDEWLCDSESTKLHFEWLTIGNDTLISQFPRGVTSYSINEWYGVIHRTSDYPEAEASEEIRDGYNLPILNATKIGGLPHFIQSDCDFEVDPDTGLPAFALETNFGKINAAFLGQLTSIQAKSEVPFPWINQKEPMDLSFATGIYRKTNQCTFGDMGSIYIYLTDDGQCAASIQDY